MPSGVDLPGGVRNIGEIHKARDTQGCPNRVFSSHSLAREGWGQRTTYGMKSGDRWYSASRSCAPLNMVLDQSCEQVCSTGPPLRRKISRASWTRKTTSRLASSLPGKSSRYAACCSSVRHNIYVVFVKVYQPSAPLNSVLSIAEKSLSRTCRSVPLSRLAATATVSRADQVLVRGGQSGPNPGPARGNLRL